MEERPPDCRKQLVHPPNDRKADRSLPLALLPYELRRCLPHRHRGRQAGEPARSTHEGLRLAPPLPKLMPWGAVHDNHRVLPAPLVRHRNPSPVPTPRRRRRRCRRYDVSLVRRRGRRDDGGLRRGRVVGAAAAAAAGGAVRRLRNRVADKHALGDREPPWTRDNEIQNKIRRTLH